MMEQSITSLSLLAVGLFGSGLAVGITAWQILNGDRSLHNFLMAIACLAGSWWVTMGGMAVSGLAERYPGFFTSDIAIIYSIGPSLYLAFRLRAGLIEPEWRLLSHGIPAAIAFCLVLPAMLARVSFKRMVLDITYSVKIPDDFHHLLSSQATLEEIYAYSLVLIKIGGKLSMMGYLSLVFQRSFELVKRPAGPYSVVALRTFACIGIFGAFVSMMSHFTGMIGAGLAVLFGTITLVGILLLDGLFSFFYSSSPLSPASASGRLPNRAVGLDADGILSRLKNLMEEDRLFCDEDLSLARLSAQLDIRPDQLSYILNRHCNQNFYGYVNGYRIEHARELLTTETEGLAFIAQSVGFNSQQVFTAVFRKAVGMTPGQFRDQARKK